VRHESGGQSQGGIHRRRSVAARWEDIAIDDQRHLFIGDIGNNDAKRHHWPSIKSTSRIRSPEVFVFVQRSWQLRYPNQPFRL